MSKPNSTRLWVVTELFKGLIFVCFLHFAIPRHFHESYLLQGFRLKLVSLGHMADLLRNLSYKFLLPMVNVQHRLDRRYELNFIGIVVSVA